MKNLKETLFFRTAAELEGYYKMKKGNYTETGLETQRERFSSAYQIVEESGLEDEYQAWKQAHENEFEF